LALAQYRELAAFAQFGTGELDPATRRQLERGQRLTEVLKQPQFRPQRLWQEVTIIYCGIHGYLDDVPVAKIQDFEAAFHRFLETQHPDIVRAIEETKDLSPETEEKLRQAIRQFKETVPY
jgi:F-type H+-transporting ATPase subunit alpha